MVPLLYLTDCYLYVCYDPNRPEIAISEKKNPSLDFAICFDKRDAG